MLQKSISKPVLGRLPTYFSYLKSLEKTPPQNISATAIASALGIGDVQVRKDLAQICNLGKPRVGYDYQGLTQTIGSFLGYGEKQDVALVGIGKLGSALYDYQGFHEYGLHLAVAFDSNPQTWGVTEKGKHILPLTQLSILERLGITMAVLAVPASQAQEVCDLLCDCGIRAIMNFAPVLLKAPEDVLIHNSNLAASLAILAKQSREREEEVDGTGQSDRV